MNADSNTFDNLQPKLFYHLATDPSFRVSKMMIEFSNLKTDEKRVDFVLPLLRAANLLQARFMKDEKCDPISMTLRELGNEWFKQGCYEDAYKMFTQSIAAAKTSQVLSFAYGNRSAVFNKVGMYKECLEDIERALKCEDCKDFLKRRLLKRQETAKKLAESQRTLAEFETAPTIEGSFRNPVIQDGSDAIKIVKNDPKYGNYVIAARDINIGEVLSVEKCFSFMVAEPVEVRCKQCAMACFNLIPCDTCTVAMYCSETCKNDAFEKYHKYECRILLSVLKLVELNYAFPLKIVLSLRNEFKNFDKLINGQDDTDPLYRSGLTEIFKMNPDYDRVLVTMLMNTACVVAYLFTLVKDYTSFFDKDDADMERVFKEMLFFLIHVTNVYGSDLSETTEIALSLLPKISNFGIALCPLSALFNHSCWPNVLKICHGTTIVCKAVGKIKAGEQCFVSYGPTCLSPLSERQDMLLKTFHFACQCLPCSEKMFVDDIESKGCSLHPLDQTYYGIQFKIIDRSVKYALKVMPQVVNRITCLAAKHKKCRTLFVWQLLLIQCYSFLGNKNISIAWDLED